MDNQKIDMSKLIATLIASGAATGGLNNAPVQNGPAKYVPNTQKNTDDPFQDMENIATDVMNLTEGDLDNPYRDAARDYIIEMAELQEKLSAAKNNPQLQKAIKEEMLEAANDFSTANMGSIL